MNPGSGLLATGSLHLVADVREEWARYAGIPLPDGDDEEGI